MNREQELSGFALRSALLLGLAVAVVVLGASLPALAQGATGTISGRVVDQTAAVIPNASVEVECKDIAVKRTVTTSADGLFVIPNLPVAVYTISVRAKGFAEMKQTHVKLDVGGNLSFNFKLQVGGADQTVTVTSEVMQTVNTESANSETLIQGTQVTEIALNGRNWAQLLNLAPGTSALVNDSQQGTNVRIDDTAINGLRRRSAPTIDGSANLVHGSAGSMINNISVDAIEEFKLVSSPYSAEYGAQAGPSISVVTRRGTDRFRGTLFEFIRNDKLNAYSWASKLVTVGVPQKPRLRFNDFGGFLGGPIVKGKLYFFGGIEWKLPRTGQTQNNATPTLAMRDGDFSAFLPIYSGTITSCGQSLNSLDRDANKFILCDKSASTNGTPFPGNKIPLNKMSPNGRAILLNMFPAPNSGESRRIDSPVTAKNVRNDLFRTDYQLRDKTTVYFRWLRDTFTSNAALGNIFENQQFANAPDHHVRVGNTLMGNWTRLLGTTAVNELAVTYQSNNQDINYQDPKQINRDTYGINFVEFFAENRQNRIPEVTVQGYPLVSGMGLPYTIRNHNWEVRDNLGKTLGRHNLKAGVMYTYMYNAENFRAKDAGQITFNAGNSAASAFKPQDAGHAVANLLLGAFATYTEPQTSTLAPMHYNQWEFYFNDQWKVTNRLTLTLGLRYQYIPWPLASDQNIVGFDPSRFNLDKAPVTSISASGTVTSDISSGLIRLIPDPTGQLTRAQGYFDPYNGLVLPGCAPKNASANLARLYACGPGGLADSGRNGWAPRVGFAFDPFGDGKTSIRGGAGIFYDRTLVNPLRDASNNPPFTQAASVSNGRQYTTPASVVPTFNNPLDTVGPAPTNLGFVQGLTLFDSTMKPGAVYAYSFGVQRQLPWQSFVDLSYVGNLGRHWTHRTDANYVLPSIALMTRTDGTYVNPTTDNVRQYRGFGSMAMAINSGSSNYNSLQFSFQKRVSRGFTASAAYTWSHALTNYDVETTSQRVPYDLGFDYGPAQFDRRHVFVVSYVYELPFLKAQRGVAGHILGGWELAGIVNWATGLHNTISGGKRGGAAPSIGYGLNVDYVGDWRDVAGGQTPAHYINKNAFADRVGMIGFVPRNMIEMPHTQNWNLSLNKRFKLNERVSLQFRGELFNLFNHPNFKTLDTNLSNTSFGQLTETDDPRVIQFGLKLRF